MIRQFLLVVTYADGRQDTEEFSEEFLARMRYIGLKSMIDALNITSIQRKKLGGGTW